jgi:hypothetical protein
MRADVDVGVIDHIVNQDSGGPAVHDVPPENIEVRHRQRKRGPALYFGEDKTHAARGDAGRMVSGLNVIGSNSARSTRGAVM